MMATVGVIHLGGALPNIALMRLSAYHKLQGDAVTLHPDALTPPERVYISCLFTWLRPKAEALAAQFRAHTDVQLGGSGIGLDIHLPEAVDAMPNDYSLYDGYYKDKQGHPLPMDYGMGYSTRGCIRKCAFCPVPRAEGHIREAASLVSLLNPQSNKVMLLDNNFFAAPSWREKVAEIQRRGLIVDWPQGNDIRLMTDEIAQALYRLHDHGQIAGDRFTQRGWLHFAWDLPANDARKEDVVRGIQCLTAAGFQPGQLRFYVLVGFPGYCVDEEVHRITTLHGLGIEPYVMVYRDFTAHSPRDPVRMALQHWNNGHAWRKCKFREYHAALAGARAAERRQMTPLWSEEAS